MYGNCSISNKMFVPFIITVIVHLRKILFPLDLESCLHTVKHILIRRDKIETSHTTVILLSDIVTSTPNTNAVLKY